jgi:methyl-accepting chemotaxis protein
MKSIRSLLLAGLAIIAVLFLVQAALLAWGQRNMEQNVIAQVQKNTIASSQLSELAVLAQQIRRYEKEYFVYVSNKERRDSYVKEWTGTSDKIAKLLQTMRTNAQGAFSAEDQGKISNWASAADFYSAEMKKVFGVVNDRHAQLNATTTAPAASPTPTAKGAPAPVAPVAVAQYSPIEVNGMITAGKDRLSGVLIKGVSEMSDAKTKATLALPEVTKNAFNKLWTGIMISVIVGLLIAAALAMKLPAAIANPIRALGEAVDRMSKGDLEQAVNAEGPKEFSTLTAALERMRVAQRTLLQRMRSRPA